MRYKVTQHPDVPLEKKSLIVEADTFTRDANGITFHNHTNNGAPGSALANHGGRTEVAWFSKLASVEIAKDEDDKTEPGKQPAGQQGK